MVPCTSRCQTAWASLHQIDRVKTLQSLAVLIEQEGTLILFIGVRSDFTENDPVATPYAYRYPMSGAKP
jgi:hypothetical protein